MFIEIILYVSIVLLYFVYDGYLRLLQLLLAVSNDKCDQKVLSRRLPTITVIIMAYNEENKIVSRLENILKCNYPEKLLEIIVASDGSDDGTDDLVLYYTDDRVRLFRPTKRINISDTQNKAVQNARGDIIIFTDAETIFDKNFIMNMGQAFLDREVGSATGLLLMATKENNIISTGQNYYWDYELRLRKYESMLGLLAVGSGACLAVRRCIYEPIKPTVGGDCVIPLQAISQGYRMVQVEEAIAYDKMHSEITSEFKARVRMTMRNWKGTWEYSKFFNPIKYNGYFLSLFCHKIMRWLSPFYIIALTISSYLLYGSNILHSILFMSIMFFYLLALVGWCVNKRIKKIVILRLPFSFMLAQAGFLIGVLFVLLGVKRDDYRNEQK